MMSDTSTSTATRSDGGGEGAAPIAAVRDITKRFPGVLANDKITLDFRAGEIHVLLGENGAGKSTLIGILAGMLQPDEGEILIAGAPVKISSPRQSLELGVGSLERLYLFLHAHDRGLQRVRLCLKGGDLVPLRTEVPLRMVETLQ